MVKKLFAILFLAASAHAAITLDTSVNGGETDGSSSLSWSHTMGAGSNNAMVVCLQLYNNGTSTPTVTFNGQSLTGVIGTGGGPGYETYLFYGVGFLSGAHTVLASATAGSYFLGVSSSYLGVNQSSVPDAISYNAGVNVSPHTSITPVASNAFAVDCSGIQTNFSYTSGSWNLLKTTTGAQAFSVASSYIGPVSSAQSNTYSISGAAGWFNLGLTMAPITTTPYTPVNMGLTINGGKLTIQGAKVTIQ